MQDSDLAVIADVHGNAWALEAVLADIARRQLPAIVNLGDNVNGPLDPMRSLQLLRRTDIVHVRGNGDRMTGEGGASARRSALYARERLDPEARRWLCALPSRVQGPGWTAFHGSPENDEEYFLENVVAGKVVLASRTEISARLGGINESLILCGHTHLPRLVRLDGGRVIVNPGSVGLPAYADDLPTPHVVENGSPHARYAIVRRGKATGWQVEFIGVPYDWSVAAKAAREAGWLDWARNVETGYA